MSEKKIYKSGRHFSCFYGVEKEERENEEHECTHAVGGDDSESDIDEPEIQEASEPEEDAEEMQGEEIGQKEDNSDAAQSKISKVILRGRNMYKWSAEVPTKRGRGKKKNIVLHLPGPKGEALRKDITCPDDAWDLFITTEMLTLITVHTNEEIGRRISDIRAIQSYHGFTDILEIKAFIGILYILGVKKSSKVNISDLWCQRKGYSLCRASFSLNCFEFISSVLRFDDKNTREERRQYDKLAPIREIWEKFIDCCKSNYTPYEYITIYEQLLAYRGRCPFKMFIPSKPDKYGMKIVSMNDAKTFYMINATPYIPYIGKVEVNNNYQSIPEYYVCELSKPIHGTNRNITVDNWFSSVDLFEKMLTKFNITMIGTLRKNKREIPATFLAKKASGSSIVCFDHNKTLVSYSPKPNKIVLLLSTLHYDNSINITTNKPEIITSYNETKGGTDTFDQLCHT